MGSRHPIEIANANPAALIALWDALCEDALIADLPYKVETNERGQLLMSPASTSHSRWQARMTYRLFAAIEVAGLGGEVLTECAVLTSQGIKVPDVAWISEASWKARANQNLLAAAPDICVEVMSASNSSEEMTHKTALYFSCGAREVWIVDEAGRPSFYDEKGPRAASAILPDFPFDLGST